MDPVDSSFTNVPFGWPLLNCPAAFLIFGLYASVNGLFYRGSSRCLAFSLHRSMVTLIYITTVSNSRWIRLLEGALLNAALHEIVPIMMSLESSNIHERNNACRGLTEYDCYAGMGAKFAFRPSLPARAIQMLRRLALLTVRPLRGRALLRPEKRSSIKDMRDTKKTKDKKDKSVKEDKVKEGCIVRTQRLTGYSGYFPVLSISCITRPACSHTPLISKDALYLIHGNARLHVASITNALQ